MHAILHYFPNLTSEQKSRFQQLEPIYREWNEKINVISRKDLDNFYSHHVLHSLSIAKYIQFAKDTLILDVGTGGGFPGIPLAILFPECRFLLVDSIGKKITVVKEVAAAIGLKNVEAEKIRAEDMDLKVDFVLSRAVAPVKDIISWTRDLITPGGFNSLKNGWLLLKGGDLKPEINEAYVKASEFELKKNFEEDFFETKKLVYIAR